VPAAGSVLAALALFAVPANLVPRLDRHAPP